ncbi:MAG: sigma-70 factor domain-containing protein, partial [Acidimicrobiia bacterium]
MYLEEVATHDLLTAEDEVRLARAMEAGWKAQRRFETTPRLTPTERARSSPSRKRAVGPGSRGAGHGTVRSKDRDPCGASRVST